MLCMTQGRWVRRARLARAGALALSLLCAGVIVHHNWGEWNWNKPGWELLLFDRASVAMGCGCAAVGYRTELPTKDDRVHEVTLGPFRYYRCEGLLRQDHFCSWRPIHVALWGYPKGWGTTRHHIVVPLWQPLAFATGVACLAQGYLIGVRPRDPLNCEACRYSLRGVPEHGGVRTCPECGQKRT